MFVTMSAQQPRCRGANRTVFQRQYRRLAQGRMARQPQIIVRGEIDPGGQAKLPPQTAPPQLLQFRCDTGQHQREF